MNKKTAYITPEQILARLLDGPCNRQVAEMLERTDINIVSSMFSVWEAFASTTEDDAISLHATRQLLRKLQIRTDLEPEDESMYLLDHSRISVLRARALMDGGKE